MSSRTFKVGDPLMHGGDIENWQNELADLFGNLKIENVPVTIDGVYGHETRTLTATLLEASGILTGRMKNGVTPKLRTRLRKDDLTDEERKRRHSKKCQRFRAKLRERWALRPVSPPVHKILGDSWGYHSGVHDGVDVLCPPDSVIYAMCDAKVVDVRSSGWWGKAPSGNVSLGDGIIQLEVLDNVGPFKKGMHIGYGHAEKAIVKVGQVVKAGQALGHAGLAVAWHVHLMVNDGSSISGRGDRDPRPLLDYAVKNG